MTLQLSGDACFKIDTDGYILEASVPVEQQLGIDSEIMIGMNVRDVLGRKAGPRVIDTIRRAADYSVAKDRYILKTPFGRGLREGWFFRAPDGNVICREIEKWTKLK